jgi:spore germination protein YaaH
VSLLKSQDRSADEGVMSIFALTRPVLSTGLAVVATVGVLATLAPPASAGQRDPQPYVTGWLPYWSSAESTRTVVKNAPIFQEASPFVFRADSASRIVLTDDLGEWRHMRASLRQAGVPVVPTVSTGMSASEFGDIVSNPKRRSAHVRALAELADRWDVAGLDLDYESINFGTNAGREAVRKYYPVFVGQLERKLQKHGRRLTVTVASRTSAGDPNWWVYAYGRLGKAADRIRIMTYDFHWAGGPPGPIAPKSWVNDVASFASRRINPGKISIGMPAYGRDWFGGTISGQCPASAKTTLSRTTADMEDFAASIGKKPIWRKDATSQYFSYTRKYSVGDRTCRAKRIVWYDDARSLQAKVGLVQRHRLRGIAIWALGNEGAGSWSRLTRYGRQLTTR